MVRDANPAISQDLFVPAPPRCTPIPAIGSSKSPNTPLRLPGNQLNLAKFLLVSSSSLPRPTTYDLLPTLFKRPPILHANHPILRGKPPILHSNHPILCGNHPRFSAWGPPLPVYQPRTHLAARLLNFI